MRRRDDARRCAAQPALALRRASSGAPQPRKGEGPAAADFPRVGDADRRHVPRVPSPSACAMVHGESQAKLSPRLPSFSQPPAAGPRGADAGSARDPGPTAPDQAMAVPAQVRSSAPPAPRARGHHSTKFGFNFGFLRKSSHFEHSIVYAATHGLLKKMPVPSAGTACSTPPMHTRLGKFHAHEVYIWPTVSLYSHATHARTHTHAYTRPRHLPCLLRFAITIPI